MAVKSNYYETLYLVRPDLGEEDISKIQQKLDDSLAAHEAEIIRSDKWSERSLAYEVQDHAKGVYYIIIYKALPGVVAALERHLKFYNTDVLRFMTVKIKEEVANREKLLEENKNQEQASESKAQEANQQNSFQAPIEKGEEQ